MKAEREWIWLEKGKSLIKMAKARLTKEQEVARLLARLPAINAQTTPAALQSGS